MQEMRQWSSERPSDLPKSVNELVTGPKPKPYFSVFLFLSLMSYLLGKEFLKSASRSPRTGSHLPNPLTCTQYAHFSQSNFTFSWNIYYTIILIWDRSGWWGEEFIVAFKFILNYKAFWDLAEEGCMNLLYCSYYWSYIIHAILMEKPVEIR